MPALALGRDRRLAAGAGALLSLLGIAVLVAWHLGIARVVTVLPGLDPVPYNTALAFLAAGTGLLALAGGFDRACAVAAGLVGLYGLLTLAQYLVGHPQGLDRLFFTPAAVPPGHTGRASPNAGLSFLLLGAGLLLLSSSRGGPARLTTMLLGAGAGVIGLVDLAATLFGLSGDSSLLVPQMALATSTGVVLFAVVLMVTGRREEAAHGVTWGGRWPLVAGVAVALCSVGLAQLLRSQERSQIRRTAEVAARGVADRVGRNLHRRTVVMETLVRIWPELPPSGWPTTALAALSAMQGRNSMAWIGPDGRMRWLAGAAALRDWTPQPGRLAEAAAIGRPLHVVDRASGGPRLVVLARAQPAAGGAGYLVMVSDFVVTVGEDVETVYPELGLMVSDAGGEVYARSRGGPVQERLWGTEVAVQAGALEWRVRVWPTAQALMMARSTLPITTLAAGMLVAVLLGLSLGFARRARLQASEAEAAAGALSAQIREREAAEEALERSQRRLRQTSQLEAVGRLAGGIAHDYNNILTVIRGNIRSLLLQGGFSGLSAEALEQADRAAARGSLLTARLLSFSQRQVLQPEPVSMAELVGAQRDQLAQLVGPSVKLVVEASPGPDLALVDRRWLGQVLLDLGFNSLEAMPLGGTLWVRTMPADTRLREEYGVLRPAGSAVVLEIEDTGRGMDEATRGRLFEPFFSTKKFGQGSGLALASAYGIVRQSGGEIAVLSTPDHGTRVGIFLPAAPEQPAAGGTDDLGGIVALAVDDEPGVLRLLQRVLAAAGCRVLAAASAEEALTVLEADGGGLDLLVTDIVMPGMSGVELADRVRAAHPGAAVLFVSGYTSDALRERGIASLRAWLVQKPFTAEELLRAVRRTLAQRSGGNPAQSSTDPPTR